MKSYGNLTSFSWEAVSLAYKIAISFLRVFKYDTIRHHLAGTP